MEGLIAFAVASVISFWGSLQLGLVNGAVIQTTLTRNARSALALAIGGVIPEIPYTLIAIYGTSFLSNYKSYHTYIGLVVGLIMILIGIYFYFKKFNKDNDPSRKGSNTRTGYFFKGVFLSVLNPQLILFWSGMIALIKTNSLSIMPDKKAMVDFTANSWLDPRIAFALGAAFGALVILFIYILLARRFRDKVSLEIGTRINKIVGLFFVLIGLFSILRNVL